MICHFWLWYLQMSMIMLKSHDILYSAETSSESPVLVVIFKQQSGKYENLTGFPGNCNSCRVCVCVYTSAFIDSILSFFFLLYSRCNLPPVTGNATKDVGSKTNLVTVNPSIITLRWVPASCVAPQNTVWLRHTFLPLLLRLTCPTAEPGKQNRRHPQSWTLTQAGLCRKNDF